MSELNRDQKQASETLNQPYALTAAAGSGKTTVLVKRYLNLLNSGLAPRQILTVTFTNEAADQMRTRILEHLDPRSKNHKAIQITKNIGTLHSFCFQILTRHGSVLDLSPVDEILSPFELSRYFSDAYRRWMEALDTDTLKKLLTDFTHTELRKLAKEYYQHRFIFERTMGKLQKDQETTKRVEFIHETFQPLIDSMEDSIQKKGAYTFDDLENYALKIVHQSEPVREALQKQYRAILVDEFQDTSAIQWNLLVNLIGNQFEKLFIVGDPKQSIYRFRNADVRIFRKVVDKIVNREGVDGSLSINYRTCRPLLEKINRVSQYLFSDAPFPFEPMAAGQTKNESGGMYLQHYEGEKRAEASTHESDLVVQHIDSLLTKNVLPSEIALLFRVSEKIPLYQQLLQSKGWPTVSSKGKSLFQLYDCLDIVNFLKAVAYPTDDYTLASFLLSDYVEFEYQDLATLAERKGDSLFEKLYEEPGKLAWFTGLIDSGEFTTHRTLRLLYQSTSHWPRQTAALHTLLAPLSKLPDSIPMAVEAIETWQRDGITVETQPGQETEKGIQLMTVHAAKGLEFEHVLLVDNLRQNPRSLPMIRVSPHSGPGIVYRHKGERTESPEYEKLKAEDRDQDIQESKRVLYVAMTRAKETLTLFVPKQKKLIPKLSWANWILESLAEKSPSDLPLSEPGA